MILLGETCLQTKKKQGKKSRKSNVDKQKYEKAVIECKKLRSLIKNVVDRNITIILKQ